MTVASFELTLITDPAKSLRFTWRQLKIDLHAYRVNSERKPPSSTKCETKHSSDLAFAAEIRWNRDPACGDACRG